MTTSSNAAARVVTIRQKDDSVSIRIPGQEDVEIELRSQSDVRVQGAAFMEKVNRYREYRPDPEPARAMRIVRELSVGAYLAISRAAAGTFGELAEALLRICRWVNDPPRRCDGSPDVIVEIVLSGAGEYLPWEWIGPQPFRPDRSLAEGRNPTRADVVAAVNELVGMADVRRLYSLDHGTMPTPTIRTFHDELQIRVFAHQAMQGVRTDVRYLHSTTGTRIVGPLPADGQPFDVAECAAHLRDPRRPQDPLDPPLADADQLVLFACHHALGSPGVAAGHAALSFSDSAGFQADTSDLADQLNLAVAANLAHQPELPVVFLNLCDGEMRTGHLASLSQMFLQNTNPAVISTTSIVHEELASLIVPAFYERFRRSNSVAASLWHAKRYVVEHYGNPLALLYVLSGDGSAHCKKVTTQ